MIYVDTSVLVAHLLAEDRRPSAELWSQWLVSSRLAEYELLVRCNARGLEPEIARQLLNRLSFVELTPTVLKRALDPFPLRVRTLDALHLATVQFLQERKQTVSLATYDQRMLQAARKLSIPLSPLCP